MKKALLLIVMALVAATLLGRWMAADSGYLLVIRDQWRLESTLGFAVLVGLLAAVALVVLTLFLNLLWNAAEPLRASRRFRRKVAGRRLKSGFILLMDGEPEKAERLLVAAGRDGDWPLMAWLLATECARQRDDAEALERHLQAAAACRRGDAVAGLLRARFLLDEGRPDRARLALRDLAERVPGNRRVQVLYADV